MQQPISACIIKYLIMQTTELFDVPLTLKMKEILKR